MIAHGLDQRPRNTGRQRHNLINGVANDDQVGENGTRAYIFVVVTVIKFLDFNR